MATGRVATTQLLATTVTTVYTVPSGYYGVYNVSFTNTTAGALTIRLALATTTTPANSEYIEYGTAIVAGGVFERTGLVAAAGQNIIAWASGGTAGANTAINVNVYGIETSTS